MYLQKTLESLKDKHLPTLNCPQCLTPFDSPKDHKCASALASHYVYKVCDPLKADPNGKIYHLQQPTCEAETQICDQCDLRYIGEDHECLSELKEV